MLSLVSMIYQHNRLAKRILNAFAANTTKYARFLINI